MSWQDRDFASQGGPGLGRPGGDWQGIRPTFDSPFTWALPLGKMGGVAIRVHVAFVAFIVIMLLRAFSSPAKDQAPLPQFEITALAMGCLLLVVLVHELGHCLACRRWGGQADEVLLWPLGGLAFCRPGLTWSAHLATALGGPVMNVLLCAVAGSILRLLPGNSWGMSLEDLLDPLGNLLASSRSWAHMTLYMVNSMSLLLLAFNLLPMFPLDGGRVVQAAFWPRLGYSGSMRLAVRMGYAGAILLGVFGAVMSRWMPVAVALFGGFTCYMTQKQVQWTDEALGDGSESDDDAMIPHSQERDEAAPVRSSNATLRAKRQAQREQQEAQEVDRILQKIADTGIESLSRGEKALLKRATERKRQEH